MTQRFTLGLFALLTLHVSFGLAQNPQSSGSPGLPIDGPPAPVPPEVITRDAAGHATLRAVRLAEPLRLDSRLEEEVYGSVPPAGGFIQQDPGEGEPATEQTETWVFFDDKNLYIAARCYDSRPDKMVANELRRDSFNIYLNDNFSVLLDTFFDQRNGFVFYTNPVGGLFDGYITDERDNNRDWNTVWDSRTQRTEDGWTLEMVIPFKSLRYKPGNPQVWGVNFRRIIRSKNEHSYLTAVPRSYGGRGIMKVSSAATLVGVEAPESGINLEVKPYAIANLKTDLAAEPPYSNDFNPNAGFDAKLGVTRGLTADFTVNTDFAQVENDEQQVNLTRFSLFFPEKRDFFLEGAGIFAFGGAGGGGGGRGGGGGGGLQSLAPILFYSRRIGISEGLDVPILAGGRLTGRAGAYTIGVLNLQTAEKSEAEAPATN
ncbi:MAG: DUF5916 domain-containing protein, partial [Acidobacteriota bacterium]